MATSLKQCVRKCILDVRKCQYIQARTHKFRTKNPRPKRMDRRIFEEITKPIYPPSKKTYLPGSCLDPNTETVEEPNPYEEFLVRRLNKRLWSSQMFIICMALPVSQVRISELKKDYVPHGITMGKLNSTHMMRLIKGTKFANLEPLLAEHNYHIVCPEVKINELLTPLKRYPELIVIGGFVADRLVTQQQLKDMAKLPPLDIALGQLVSLLNMAVGGRTLSLLNSHQQRLSTNLEQYRKQLGEPNNEQETD